MQHDRSVVLLVFSGLPGTGKSTVASEVVARRPAVLLSVDPIESAMARAGIAPSFERGLAAYLAAGQVAEDSLRAGLDVVIDAVNSVEPARALWRGIAARTGASLRVVVCTLDESEQRIRLASRQRSLASGEPEWADVEDRRAEWTEWPEPCLRLDTADDPARSASRVLRHLGGTGRGRRDRAYR